MLALNSSDTAGNILVRNAQTEAARKTTTDALAAKAGNLTKINDAAKNFEAVFATAMIKPMFDEMDKGDPMFGGGKGEQAFNGMLQQQYGKQIAEHDSFGIADQIKSELLKLQEAKTNGNG